MALDKLLSIEPDFTIQRFIANSPFERESDRDLYVQGFRMAHVPEHDRVTEEVGYAASEVP